MTKRQECGILYVSAVNRCWPTIALPEMIGFYNTNCESLNDVVTIALPEMTGFYNDIFAVLSKFLTIALLETAGLWFFRENRPKSGIPHGKGNTSPNVRAILFSVRRRAFLKSTAP